MKRFVVGILLSCVSALAFAKNDSIQVSGKVMMDSNPVDGLIVMMLQPSDSSVLAYALTNKEGVYSIGTSTKLSQLLLKVSGFNIKKQIKEIVSRTQTVDFVVVKEGITLKEIVVKSQKMWNSRDTLNYLVSAYMNDHDRTIGDVLRKLPGIKVGEDGTISYQGTPISNLYIENLNMLQRDYKIAPEAIKADDVASVQVMENHQEVKSLQDQKPSGQVAINLKLKDKAKGVWTLTGELAAGADGNGLLWDLRPTATFFGKKRQTLARYEGRNTVFGFDYAKSDNEFYLGLYRTLTNVLEHNGSPFGNQTFGDMNWLRINNLNKLSDTETFTLQSNYSRYYAYGNSFAKSTFLLPDNSSIRITEEIADNFTNDCVNLVCNYTNNSEKNYINNNFVLAGIWSSAGGVVQTSTLNSFATMSNLSKFANIVQDMRYRTLGCGNSARGVRRTENGGGFRWNSYSNFAVSPQKLSLSGNTYGSQDVNILYLSSKNNFTTLKNLALNVWSVTLSGSIDANFTQLKTVLETPVPVVSPKGDLSYFKTIANFGPVLQYAKGGVYAQLSLPATVSYTMVNNLPIPDDDTDAKRLQLYVEPQLSLLWKCSDMWSVESEANYNTNSTSWDKLLTASLMKNYRVISRYRVSLADIYNGGANVKFAYKDVFSNIFAYIQGSLNREWSEVAYGQSFDKEGQTVIVASYTPNHRNSYVITTCGRKDIDWHTLQLELTVTGSCGNSDVLRQSVLTKYNNRGYTLQGSLDFDIIRGWRVGYQPEYVFNSYYSKNTPTVNFSQLKQRITIDMRLIPSRLSLRTDVNHIYNKDLESARKNYTFINSTLKYHFSKKIEFELHGSNLTNIHTYAVRQVADMQEIYYESSLRPLAVMLKSVISF